MFHSQTLTDVIKQAYVYFGFVVKFNYSSFLLLFVFFAVADLCYCLKLWIPTCG